MRTYLYRGFGLILFLFIVISASLAAPQEVQVFALPNAHAGGGYRVEIEAVLREKYRLKLESGTQAAIIQWMLVDGDLPAGISVRTDGTVIGEPAASRVEAYRFRLKAVDASARDEELFLDFSLVVKAGRLRLSKIEGPRLVPTDMRSPAIDKASSPRDIDSSPPRGSTPMSANAHFTPATVREGAPMANIDVATVRAPKPEDATSENIQDPFSTMNRRLILGVEQSGAASAESQGNPFFDFFISTPLSRDDTGNSLNRPRFSVWGDVRLTSTPEQIAAFADVSSNAIDSVTGGKLNQLGQGFDFVVGPEIRLRQFHHTDLSLIGGFGAVSPLSPKKSAQIFQVPDTNSSLAAAFFQKYKGAVGKQYIAFVAPDRDRFLRQYFAGFRFKTYSYDGAAPQNIFPAMLDVTFGQSEAVTGGILHKFVVGIDGFYPLPFPDKSRFLYLFGTAKFKAGGPKNTATPFILDTAPSSIGITDPKVFIADPTPTNRDYYRIGFGVDLIELFNFAKNN